MYKMRRLLSQGHINRLSRISLGFKKNKQAFSLYRLNFKFNEYSNNLFRWCFGYHSYTVLIMITLEGDYNLRILCMSVFGLQRLWMILIFISFTVDIKLTYIHIQNPQVMYGNNTKWYPATDFGSDSVSTATRWRFGSIVGILSGTCINRITKARFQRSFTGM